MRLETLELVVRREVRILVVKMHDESDRDQMVAEVVDEGAATGRRIERPALRMDDEPRLMLLWRDFP